MKEIIKEIVQLQSNANDKAKPDWLANPPPYLCAAGVKSFDTLEHISSWKWLKAAKPDFKQASMEMVDILHFIVSQEIINFNGDLEATSNFITEQFNVSDTDAIPQTDIDFDFLNDAIESMSGKFIAREIDYPLFILVTRMCGLSLKGLFTWYIGKNALNNARQALGYKDGTYQKIWDGKEDNVYLVEIIEAADESKASETSLYDHVYSELLRLYQHYNG
ncbi:dUTP diphosphatase (plasmid) [Alteromonas macleodii]|uniref:dUTP diphosphatase n=1 Tax=Alteromonas macleodii TaxID=28108 RepID=UPI0030CC666E